MLGISEGCISSSPLHRVAGKLQRTERDWLILKQTRGCAVDKDMVMMMMMPFISRLEGEKAQCGNWAENIKRSFNYEMMPTLECHHFLFSQPLASFFFSPCETFCRLATSSDFMMRRLSAVSKGEPQHNIEASYYERSKYENLFIILICMEREKCWGGDTHFRERKLNLFFLVVEIEMIMSSCATLLLSDKRDRGKCLTGFG